MKFLKLVFLLPLVGTGLMAAADAPVLSALGLLQPGQWTLTSRDGGFDKKSMCITDPQVLLHVKQPSTGCSKFVVANDLRSATITYTCQGAGSGRTTVRVETPRLAQVETQGLVRGTPFDLSIEARRTGDCTAISMR